jgi:hypothetical protein
MKNILLVMLFLVNVISAQTVYEVQPNTKGNAVILSIVNESTIENAGRINVTLQNEPQSIEVKNCGVQIDELKKGEEKEAQFVFDVKRIPIAKKDTLKFSVTTKTGESWVKEIVLAYALPTEFKLEQNYPNPFNPTTTIEFSLPKEGKYMLRVFNILGETVKILADDQFDAGYHQITFNARAFASGVYFYALNGDGVKMVKKMMLLK